VSSGRPHRLSVYHAGRGHDPVVVAAKGTSLVAVNAISYFLPSVIILLSAEI
jgi:hypothetical protein